MTQRLTFLSLMLATLGIGVPRAYADFVVKGTFTNPNVVGATIEWQARYALSPGGMANSVHFWFDVNLAAGTVGGPFTFVVCGMFEINNHGLVTAQSFDLLQDGVSGQWKCNATGTTTKKPNFHFACKRVTLTVSQPGFNVFDKVATFPFAITKADIQAPYVDFVIDCPNGIDQPSCSNLVNQHDRWLVPQKGGAFGPASATNWWVSHGGLPLKFQPPFLIELVTTWDPGNWWTMNNPTRFPSLLEGTISGAPAGALVEFQFPPSTGGGVQRFRVPGVGGCAGDPLNVAIPYTLSEALMGDRDQNVTMRVSWTSENCPLYPAGEGVIFDGQVTATEDSFFPDGTPLYTAGDFMHGTLAQFIADYDPPFVVSQQLRQVPNTQDFEIAVRASDPSTMAMGATLRFMVNGQRMPDFPIPFDDPAEIEGDTLFRGIFGRFPAGSVIQYEILLVDDAGNESSSCPRPGEFCHSFPPPAAGTGR